MDNTLYLASQSQSRQQLLKESNIPFTLLSQQADEAACDWALPIDQLVASIALHKMNQVQIPDGIEGDKVFVLTADTLSQDTDGTIQAKPTNRQDAIAKIKKARNGSTLCTAFCLDKNVFKDGQWHIADRIHEVVRAEYLFYVSDNWIERYLEKSIGLSCSNAIAVELYGAQFLKYIRGSYTAVVGLPMYELREALERMGFFK